jgi:UDP-GlcNAc:undecaprenyl-phosphate GlcNAc-1-phosphate transferase
MGSYLLAALVGAGVAFVATPLVRRLALATGAVDHPNDRSVHPADTPTMGGIAMFAGLVAGVAVSFRDPATAALNAGSPEPVAVLVAAALAVGLGAIDDRRGTRPLTKLIAQIFIAGVLVLLGVQFAWFPWPGADIVVLSPDLAVVLSIVWVVAAMNAVNLVDGLDGLAAGMVAIAATAFFVYLVRSPGEVLSQAALLSAITTGVCVGFLPWNFHPAKIFMGDTGSLMLGLLLAVITISGLGRDATPPSGGDIVATAGVVVVPLLVLFIPLLDVALAVIRRTRRGTGIARADKEHLHHRLMDIGHGHRQAVLLMYLWSGLVAAAMLAVGLIDGRALIGGLLVAVAALFAATAFPRLARRDRG